MLRLLAQSICRPRGSAPESLVEIHKTDNLLRQISAIPNKGLQADQSRQSCT